MHLKKNLNCIAIIGLLFLVTVLSSCKTEHNEQGHDNHVPVEGKYICPMRCEGDKTYTKPGFCPVCKMKLQLVEEELVQTFSPNNQVLSRQATVKLNLGNSERTEQAQGFVTIAQNRNQSVAARFGGRIEKLYVKFNNQYVKQGDKIMDIYSPDLRTIQEEHLLIVRSKAENNLIDRSIEKLRLLGITENQITKLEKDGTVALTISVYSPDNGYVFFNTQSAQEGTSAKSSLALNAMSMNPNTNNEGSIVGSSSQIREGVYVNEGQTLFSVNDLQEVWALVSVSNHYLNQIYVNQSVIIISESNPLEAFNGKVSLIEKTFEDANQRFARVRIVLPNSSNLLIINSLVTAQFDLSNNIDLEVPASAVYKTGLNAYVWVKTDTTQLGTGIFKVRKVIIGSGDKGMIAIKSGISLEEEIALHAGLMTDSETFLNER